jgi:hypothetical protein
VWFETVYVCVTDDAFCWMEQQYVQANSLSDVGGDSRVQDLQDELEEVEAKLEQTRKVHFARTRSLSAALEQVSEEKRGLVNALQQTKSDLESLTFQSMFQSSLPRFFFWFCFTELPFDSSHSDSTRGSDVVATTSEGPERSDFSTDGGAFACKGSCEFPAFPLYRFYSIFFLLLIFVKNLLKQKPRSSSLGQSEMSADEAFARVRTLEAELEDVEAKLEQTRKLHFSRTRSLSTALEQVNMEKLKITAQYQQELEEMSGSVGDVTKLRELVKAHAVEISKLQTLLQTEGEKLRYEEQKTHEIEIKNAQLVAKIRDLEENSAVVKDNNNTEQTSQLSDNEMMDELFALRHYVNELSFTLAAVERTQSPLPLSQPAAVAAAVSVLPAPEARTIADLQEDVKELESHLLQTRQMYTTRTNELKETIERLNAENKLLLDEFVDVKSSHAALLAQQQQKENVGEKFKMDASLGALEAELEQAEARVKSLEAENNSLKDFMTRANDEISQLQSQLTIIQQQQSAFSWEPSVPSVSEAEISSLRSQLSAANEKLASADQTSKIDAVGTLQSMEEQFRKDLAEATQRFQRETEEIIATSQKQLQEESKKTHRIAQAYKKCVRFFLLPSFLFFFLLKLTVECSTIF